MPKTTYFFGHDYNARNDEKILMLRAEYGAEAYGVFWMIIETMAESSDGTIDRGAIGGLCLGYGVAKESLSKIIDYALEIGLFQIADSGRFYSPRIMEHRESLENLRAAGRKGAKKRWGSQSYRGAIATPMQRKGKERKEEDKKEDNATTSLSANADVLDEFDQFLQWLNARRIFPNAKQATPAARTKWKTRRLNYPARRIAEAFANLLNEPDKWKINNNGQRPLAWWLHSDERIEDMLGCHLKKTRAQSLSIPNLRS